MEKIIFKFNILSKEYGQFLSDCWSFNPNIEIRDVSSGYETNNNERYFQLSLDDETLTYFMLKFSQYRVTESNKYSLMIDKFLKDISKSNYNKNKIYETYKKISEFS